MQPRNLRRRIQLALGQLLGKATALPLERSGEPRIVAVVRQHASQGSLRCLDYG